VIGFFVFCQSSTYRDGHGAAPGRAPAGGAGALGVLGIAGSNQRRVILLGLVLQPGHLHAVSAHTTTQAQISNARGGWQWLLNCRARQIPQIFLLFVNPIANA